MYLVEDTLKLLVIVIVPSMKILQQILHTIEDQDLFISDFLVNYIDPHVNLTLLIVV